MLKKQTNEKVLPTIEDLTLEAHAKLVEDITLQNKS